MDWKVFFALLTVFATLVCKANGRSSKDAKLKGGNLKTKLHQKILYHHHHHHRHQHHHHHHHHHHPHHHHDKHKHHRHHHLHLHHHHNPIKHYLHHSHHHHHHHHYHHHPHPPSHHRHHHHHHYHHHHHPHKHPLHLHRKQNMHPPSAHNGHLDNRRSHISHPPLKVPNKLKVHVHIKDEEAVKRQSLPDLLSNLGQNLMKLGKHMSIKKSNSSVPSTDNPDKKANITEGLPIPHFTFDAEGLSSTSAVIPKHSQGKNVTVGDVEALLHKALDGMSGDEIESDSGSGSGEEMTDTADTTEDTTTDASLTGSGSSLSRDESPPESADRRNQTFPEEPEIYLLSGRHSAYDSQEDTAEDSKVSRTDSKEKRGPVYGDQLNDIDLEKTGSTESADMHMAKQFGNIHDNGTRGESSNSINQSQFDEPRSPDMNSTFEDTEGKTDREINSFAVEGTVTGQNATLDGTEREKNAEASGSGDEPANETNYNNDHTDQADENMSQGDVSERDASNVPAIDEDENGSGQNTDQNGIENAEGQEHDQEAFINKTAKQDTFDDSRRGMLGETDQQTAEHFVGNQIMANKNEASFQPNRTKESQSEEVIDAAASEDKLMNKSDINRPRNEPVQEEHLDEGSTAQDVNEYSNGDFDPPATQPVLNKGAISETNVGKGFQTRVEQSYTHEYSSGDFNSPVTQPVFKEPERATSVTNIEKGFQTQDGQLNIKDVQQNQLNKPDQLANNTIDDVSGGNNFAQESTDESQSAWVQEQGPQTDNTRLPEGPSFSNDDYSAGTDRESTQLADLYSAASQENRSEDEPDETPVYTLSFPRSEESFPTEESTTSPLFTAPTSSDATPSDPYGETLTLPDGESSFSTIDAPSQDDQSPAERIGYQKDMLDDPVQESLDTAVDNRRSNVAKLKVKT